VLGGICTPTVTNKTGCVFFQVKEGLLCGHKGNWWKSLGVLALPRIHHDHWVNGLELGKEFVEGLPFAQSLLLLVELYA